jgi:hypothetical protein
VSGSRAVEPHAQRFDARHVEPTPQGLLAWHTLTVPPPSDEETRAMVQLLLKRGLRHSDLAEVRRLGFPLD